MTTDTELDNATENFDYAEDEDGEENTNLLNGKEKEENGNNNNVTCFHQWKLLLSGLGVVLMISLGVVIGASFNGKKHFRDVNLHHQCKYYNNLRLPNNVDPLKYRVYLHPNITDAKFDFTGDVRILVKIKSDTDLIVLHTKQLKIVSTMVHDNNDIDKIDDGPKADLSGTSECKRTEQIMIKLKKKVLAGKMLVVHIEFKGHLSATVLEGFYLSSYKSKDKSTHYLATTHFEATGARMAFPCFDEPAMKATFEIIMVRESAHKSLSNMPIQRSVARTGTGLVTDYFKESLKMSTYLVAFVVCDYTFLESKTKRGIKVKVWAPVEQIDQGKFALDTAVKVLDYYESFFQVDFPLPKMDLIAIPDFSSGAMENWGLITYRLTSILYKEGESSSSNKQWVAEVVAHELAHQWFGDIVTMKWWNDLWLNEGFASFMDFVGGNHVVPKWKMMDQFVVRYVQSALVLDSHLNSHAISVPVKDPAEIHELFDSISYDKGASIIRMMKDFLGKDAFHRGLSHYLNKYKYQNAASDDLWKCLSDASGKIDVKKVMDTWTLQMGFPVINIKRNKNAAIATQEHFIIDEITPDTKIVKSKFNYKWEVPLTYHFQGNKTQALKWFHFDEKSTSFNWNVNDGWLKVNCKQIGFYRVNYDMQNWKALEKQLNEDHTVLDDSDRANILDDVFELAKAGRVPQELALNLTTYMYKETEYVPFKTVLGSIAYIGGMLKNRPGYKYYKKYILKQMKPLMVKLGWEDTGTHLERYLRSSVQHAAVAYEDPRSIKIAKKIFNDHRFNNKSISPNLRSTIYLAATKYGDEKEWNYMFQKFLNSPYPSEKKKLMYSLTSTTNPKLLKVYLQKALNISVIRSQDGASVIGSIARNPVGQAMTIEFVQKNWGVLFARYGAGSFSMARLIKNTFGGLKTTEGLKDAEKFMKRDLGSGKMSGKRTLAIIRNHIKWLERNEKTVVDWFKQHV